jgi:transcriptional regulator with XRE-family HTH domain
MMFAIMLRARLRDLGHTQHEMADALTQAGAPTSRQAISHWLTGESKPDPRRWATLLEVLEVAAGDRARWLEALLFDHDVRATADADGEDDTAGA